ncbi:hypothetical protein RHGRI_032082 [Rhododendron griersonianum]|uniref:GST C-terminal domain-containing protein n=1 Tax=Rhododendron griersonianum TaxID=479676 RepID=A0AAV6IAB9_9ERIC|nr:hypothetical protein RHGRI_032082 [Rhododendron griersonianum]
MASSVEQQKKLKLYSYFRSSCSHRVRIALKLKEFTKLNPIGYVPVLVDEDIVVSDSFAILLVSGLGIYPLHLIIWKRNILNIRCCLVIFREEQSTNRSKMKSIDFFNHEARSKEHKNLLNSIQQKTDVLVLLAANIVSSSIQPFQNLGVMDSTISAFLSLLPFNMQKYIAEKVNSDEQYVWARNHIGKGFEALEKLLHDYAGKYATGDEVYLADCFIAPQLYWAIKMFSLDMTPYPLLSRLNEAYNQLPAFVDSAPENQPDTPV